MPSPTAPTLPQGGLGEEQRSYRIESTEANLPVDGDPTFAEVQSLLFGAYRERLSELHIQLNELNRSLTAVEQEVEHLTDIERLAEKIRPSLAPAIAASIRESREGMVDALSPIIARLITASIHDSRDAMVHALFPIMDRLVSTSVRESRESMVDALYPIIGRLVSRAVAEALRDLVQRIDDQMRSALNFRVIVRRMQARIAGVPDAEFTLRSVLPFHVLQIFLIHRETGLLLNVLADDPMLMADSDLISGMLTAIRDFAQDAIGRGQDGDLDEVQYGDKRILIESARHVYIALVSNGSEPLGFRTDVRERLLDIEEAYLSVLRDYDGDASRFARTTTMLQPLLMRASLRINDGLSVGSMHTVPLLRHDRPLRWSMAVRLTFSLLFCVFLLLLWRIWHAWSYAPTVAQRLFESLLSEWGLLG